jgi:hypothetical protein
MTITSSNSAADTTGTGNDNTTENSGPKRWRDVLPIHPAAELFPLMSEAELRELADDIEEHDLHEPVDLYYNRETQEIFLVDGRNRLDALELLGRIEIVSGRSTRPRRGRNPTPPIMTGGLLYQFVGGYERFDPFAFVLSKNVHRRHLTPDQRHELIVKVLKARPEASNRQIAKQVKADDKTVAKVRTELEATAEIPQLERTTGADGKARRAHRHTPEPVPSPPIERKPASRPSPSKLPTLDHVLASGPVDALCQTLTEVVERDQALAQAYFEAIVARLRAAMDRVSETDSDDQVRH